jgi:hypothetical protein
MGNKVRGHRNCNTLKKGKEYFSMKTKMNKIYIGFFCTLKNVGTHFNQNKTKFKYRNNEISTSSTFCVN